MANPEHLEILDQGVEAWNQWRKDNLKVFPDLREANLLRADLSGANLSGANLHWANLSRANISGTNISNARIGWSTFTDNDLSSVNGLDNVDHSAPSAIGINTLYISAGKIPEVSLRGCGVPEIFITFAKSLV